MRTPIFTIFRSFAFKIFIFFTHIFALFYKCHERYNFVCLFSFNLFSPYIFNTQSAKTLFCSLITYFENLGHDMNLWLEYNAIWNLISDKMSSCHLTLSLVFHLKNVPALKPLENHKEWNFLNWKIYTT